MIGRCRWSDLIGQRSVQKVASGRSHTLILLDDGTVESCGSNDRGQLGRKETSHDLLGEGDDVMQHCRIHYCVCVCV